MKSSKRMMRQVASTDLRPRTLREIQKAEGKLPTYAKLTMSEALELIRQEKNRKIR
jgi:hypothetical protein